MRCCALHNTYILYALPNCNSAVAINHFKLRMQFNYYSSYLNQQQEDVNLYGAHPFYMASESDGSSHGVFFYNSHAIGTFTLVKDV